MTRSSRPPLTLLERLADHGGTAKAGQREVRDSEREAHEQTTTTAFLAAAHAATADPRERSGRALRDHRRIADEEQHRGEHDQRIEDQHPRDRLSATTR